MTPRAAQAVMDHHARSFAPPARLLSRADQARVARLYALCRTVDDLADEDGGAAARDRLAAIEADIRAGRRADPVAEAADDLFAGRSRARRACADLVAGVRSDLSPVRIADMTALDAYAHAVAGTVGIMFAELFDVPPDRQGPAADLGKALQLTNICRDVAEDARAGRRYLPATLCPHAPETLVRHDPAAARDAHAAIAALLDRADGLYARGLAGLPALPARPRVAVAVAAALYRGIGVEIRSGRADPLTTRAVVPARRKALLAARTLLRGPAAPSVARRPSRRKAAHA